MKKKISLKSRFIISSYVSIAMSIIMISLIGYFLLSYSSEQNAIKSSIEISEQRGEFLSIQIDNMENTLRDITFSRGLQRLLEEYNTQSISDIYRFKTSVNETIGVVTQSLNLFDNIVIFSANGEMVGNLFGFDQNMHVNDYEWFTTLEDSKGETYWLSDQVTIKNDHFGKHYSLPAVKKIRSLNYTGSSTVGETLGYVFVSINLNNLFNIIENRYSTGERRVFIVDGQSRVIGGDLMGEFENLSDFPVLNSKNKNTYVSINDKEYLLTYYKTNSYISPFFIMCLISKNEILADANFAILICFFIALVLLIVFFAFSVKNANSLSRPIKTLERYYESVEKGDFKVQIHEQSNITEISNLFSRFNIMVSRLETLIKEVYEARIKEQKLIVDVRQAELQALQMQINPHFLYNTLDSINWMALMQGNEEVSSMTIALGHLFRSNMNVGGIYTTIKEAIETLELFMYLEQVRFGEKLSYHINCDVKTQDAYILKHLLQPLVENSIKHGIESYNIQEEIDISISMKEDMTVISVTDNGNGIEAEKLNHIKNQWESLTLIEATPFEEASNSVGLSNIMKRLKLCYGEKAKFSVTSNITKGTLIIIEFPTKYTM